MMIFLREKFIAQIFMWIIAVVFVIASVLLYSGSSGQRGAGAEDEVVLKIDALEVTRGHFEDVVSQQMRSQQQRSQNFGGEIDRKNVEQTVINSLIRRAIESSAQITDGEVEHYIRSDKNRVQQYNQFGPEIADLYKQNVRVFLSSTALRDGIQTLELVTDTEAEQDYLLESEKAKIKYIEFRHSDYITTIYIDDSEVEEYFNKNKENYKTEEQVNVKFIKIDPIDFVSKADIEKYYADNQSEFMTSELVRARHILKKFPDNATEEQKAETKTAAEELLKTITEELAAGTSFADLAKTHSEGPSGTDGGALGTTNPDLPPGKYFGRGQMVKPFEEACFDILKPGEVSELVETRFGYHIISLEEKFAPTLKPFTGVEIEIKDKLVKINGVDNAKEVAENLLFDIEVGDYETAIGLDRYKDLLLAVGETGFFAKDADIIPGGIGSKWTYGGLIDELFDMGVGVTNTIETKKYNGDVAAYFVATVLGKKASAIPTFDEVKVDVVNHLRTEKSKERAVAAAENLYNQRADGELLDSLVKKYKAEEDVLAGEKTVQESSLFNRTAGSSYVSGMGNSKDVMFGAFNMSVGDVRGPYQGDSSAYIIELVERVEPDLELFRTDPSQKTKRYQTILQQKKQDAYDNWFAARKEIANVWVHEDYR